MKLEDLSLADLIALEQQLNPPRFIVQPHNRELLDAVRARIANAILDLRGEAKPGPSPEEQLKALTRKVTDFLEQTEARLNAGGFTAEANEELVSVVERLRHILHLTI